MTDLRQSSDRHRRALSNRELRLTSLHTTTTSRRVVGPVPVDSLAWRGRALGACALFSVVFLGLAVRAVLLAVGPQDKLDRRLAQQGESRIDVAPERGAILDRLGRPLAISVELGSVFADPSQIRRHAVDEAAALVKAGTLAADQQEAFLSAAIQGAADLLAPILGKPSHEIRPALAKADSEFSWLGRQLPMDTVRAVQALKVPGIHVVPESHREYPSGVLGAPLLGFVNIDGEGLEGLEGRWNRELLGEEYSYRLERDGRRRATNYEAVLSRHATEGNTLVLTIDHAIQHRAESALAGAIERHQAAGGWVLVLDARDGAVLAMASNPTFDPSAWQDSEPIRWRNRAVTDVYEPGSTMKSFVIAEVLDKGLTTEEEIVDCEGGNYRIGGRVIHDAHGHGLLSVADVLKVSSNIGTAKLGDRLGAQGLEDLYRRFGFGRVTGIDVAGEERGILHAASTWSRVGFANHAFGQGMAVTGLQLAAAYAALVNGGVAVVPHVVAELRSPSGAVLEQFVAPPPTRVLGEATSIRMRELMARVLEPGGTGPRAAMAEYRAGGKTGTAQKVRAGRYAPGLYVSSFIGFAPAEDPRIVTLAVLDEPKKGHYGGTVAGPIFKEVSLEAMRILGVQPSPPRTPEPLPPGTPVVMPEEPADIAPRLLADDLGLLGGENADLDPAARWIAELDEQPLGEDAVTPPIIAEIQPVAGGWLVPDVSGLNPRDALRALKGADIVIDLIGSGLVHGQSPAPGERIRRGERVALQLALAPQPAMRTAAP